MESYLVYRSHHTWNSTNFNSYTYFQWLDFTLSSCTTSVNVNMYFNQLVFCFLFFVAVSYLKYSSFVLKVRRWGANITNKLFTLSAAEEKLLHDSQASKDTNLTKD